MSQAVSQAAASATRDRMFDGIRGYAIVLVLLSHTWTVAPTPDWTRVSWLLFSGDYAVTIFFVVSGFLATRGMLGALERTGRVRPVVTWLRRWLRISAHVYPMVLVILGLAAANTAVSAAYAGTNSRESALHIFTYTWNGYLREHPVLARPDFGHLWYVCTDIWGVALILLLVVVLGRARPALFAALAATILAVTVYRQHVYQVEGVFAALIRVQTRVDGLVWGALGAVALPWLRRLDGYARLALVTATLALVPLLKATLDAADYLGFGGTLLSIDTAVFVVAVSLAKPPVVLERIIGWTLLVLAGRYSLVLYVWHYPLFWYVAKIDTDWSWQTRTVVAYALTFAVATLAQLVVERPLQRLLRSPRWQLSSPGTAVTSPAHRKESGAPTPEPSRPD
jgi:peptidoglycan/LPS O-acetylase OafA/YrhL